MLFKNIRYHILLPFRNLSTQGRILQVIRLFTCCVTLSLIIASLLGSLVNRDIYIARINCAHLDVARGLYKTLRNSVSSTSSVINSGNDVLPVDSSLTNSEISILTYYAESEVANAPQYIVTSLWSWCYGNYNTTEHVDKYGVVHIHKHNDVLTCSKSTKRYIFDYRRELEMVGLDGILAYAYQSSDINDKLYERTVSERNKKYKLVPSGLIFSASSQLVVLVFGYVLYSNRGPEKDLDKIPIFLLNIIALISVASFISIAVSAGIVTNLLIQIRGEIKSNLGSYGIALHVGRIWVLLIWVAFVFSFFSMMSWTFPLWCANPPDFDEEEEEDFDASYGTGGYFNDDNTDVGSVRRLQSGSSKYNRFIRSTRHKSRDSQYNKLSDLGIKENDIEERDYSDDDDDEYDDEEFYRNVNNRKYDAYGADNEDELRKLGETLSRKMSVRRLNRKFSKKNHNKSHSKSHPLDDTCSILDDQHKNLLYQDVNINGSQYPLTESTANHYREETFDGYVNSYKPTTSASAMSLATSKNLLNKSNKLRDNNYDTPVHDMMETNVNTKRSGTHQRDPNFRSNSLQERYFKHNTLNNPFLQSEALDELNRRYSNGDSFLNLDEMEILDNNNYINRI